jgi:hypothetical protein
MFTIRRHLARGKYFGYFQIRGHVTDSKQGEVIEYVNPNTHSIIFNSCRLHNKINQSTKIFNGAQKEPCAYIICTSYEVVEPIKIPGELEVNFNPKLSPHWRMFSGRSIDLVDFALFTTLITFNSKVYAI